MVQFQQMLGASAVHSHIYASQPPRLFQFGWRSILSFRLCRYSRGSDVLAVRHQPACSNWFLVTVLILVLYRRLRGPSSWPVNGVRLFHQPFFQRISSRCLNGGKLAIMLATPASIRLRPAAARGAWMREAEEGLMNANGRCPTLSFRGCAKRRPGNLAISPKRIHIWVRVYDASLNDGTVTPPTFKSSGTWLSPLISNCAATSEVRRVRTCCAGQMGDESLNRRHVRPRISNKIAVAPYSIQHSRTKGLARNNSSNARRSAPPGSTVHRGRTR